MTKPLSIGIGLCCLVVAGWFGLNELAPIESTQQDGAPMLFVTMLDVGQGDAFHLRTPGGVDLLVDAGRDASVLEQLRYSLPLSDRTLEYVLVTHPDADHIGGMPFVLERFHVETVLANGDVGTSSIAEAFYRDREREGAELVRLRGGDQIALSEHVSLRVLWPLDDMSSVDRNSQSVVFMVYVGRIRMLFTGDIEAEAEHAILTAYAHEPDVLHADVLKVAHHGSVSSTTQAFLDAVSPTIAWISAGLDNPFHHPHERTIRTLQAADVRTYRTDVDGTVSCSVSEEHISCAAR